MVRVVLSLVLSVAVLAHAGPLAAAPFAYVLNRSSDDVSVVDLATNATIATVPTSSRPWGLALHPDGSRLYVADRAPANRVSVVDLSTRRVAAILPAGTDPIAVALSPDATRLYVANQGSNDVSVFDTATRSLVATVAVGAGCSGVAVSPAGARVYVANSGSNSLSVIDASTHAVVKTVAVGARPRNVAVSPDGRTAFVTNAGGGSVSVVDLDTHSVRATVPVGTGPEGIAVNPSGTRVYVANGTSSTLSVLEPATATTVATIPVGSNPIAVAVNASGTQVYVSSQGIDEYWIIDASTNAVVGRDTQGGVPAGIVVSPDGARVYVANPWFHAVYVNDPVARRMVGQVATGGSPANLAVNATTGRVYVDVFETDSLFVVDATSQRLVDTIALGLGDFVVNPAGTRIYGIGGPDIVVLDIATKSIVARVPIPGYTVPGAPRAIAMSADGTRVYFATEGLPEGRLIVLDTTTDRVVTSIPLGFVGAADIAVSADGRRIYVVTDKEHGEVAVFDAVAHTRIAKIEVGRYPGKIVLAASSPRAYVGDASENTAVIDTTTHAVAGLLPTGKYAAGLALNPEETLLYVTNYAANSVTAIDLSTGTAVASIPVGRDPGNIAILAGAGTSPTVANVIEYYHRLFDHYFITWRPGEIGKLDEGVEIKGWTRTGLSFKTNASPQEGTSPVCRYYIPPELGDSHFFGRGTVECNDTGRANPSFVLEDANFMHMRLPIAGVCPAGTTPVYRVFSNRADANHRYTTDPAVRDQMVARGWLAEGDGPDLVVMCGPR